MACQSGPRCLKPCPSGGLYNEDGLETRVYLYNEDAFRTNAYEGYEWLWTNPFGLPTTW